MLLRGLVRLYRVWYSLPESHPRHREAAIEKLTRILLAQEERLSAQSEIIKRLSKYVRAFIPSQIALREWETPPPPY